MRALAATFAVAAFVALSALAAAEAAPARSEKLTASEQKWVTPLISVWNDVNLNLHIIQGELRATNALVPGSGKNNTILTATLNVLVSCPDRVKKAGTPPSTRLVAFQTSMKAMCGYMAIGAHDIAKAIGALVSKKHDAKLAVSLITQATAQFKTGSTPLGTAQKQLIVIGGKNVFTA